MIKLIGYMFFRFFSDSKKTLFISLLILCNLFVMSFQLEQINDFNSSEILGDLGNNITQNNIVVTSTVSDIDHFKNNIDDVIDMSHRNKSGSSGLYLQYLNSLFNIYTDLRSTLDISSVTFSNSQFFTYTFDVIFCIAGILIFVFTIFTQDYSLGLSPLTRSTSYGYKTLPLCKLISIIVFSILLLLSLLLTEFICYGSDLDISSPVQVLPYMALCPYQLSISDFLLISFFCKLLVCISYVFVCMIFICKSSNALWGMFSSLVIAGLCILSSKLTITSSFSILKYFPPLNMADPHTLFARYSAVALFKNLYPAVPLVFGVYIIAIILLFFLVWFLSISYCPFQHSFSKKNFRISFPPHSLYIHRKSYSLSILNHEFYKCIVSSKIIIIIILTIFVSYYIQTTSFFVSSTSANELYYKEFIEDYSGEDIDSSLWTSLKSEDISITADILQAKKTSWNTAHDDFAKGKITIEDYESILTDCSDAVNKCDVFRKIETYNAYLSSINSSACFVYDTGWNFLFQRSLDLPVYIAILLVSTILFSIETDKKVSAWGADTLIRTTIYGRKQTYHAKIIVALLCCMIVYFFSELLTVTFIIKNYTLPLHDAPIKSLIIFKNTILNSTIGQTFLMYECVRFLQLVSFSFIFLSFSHLLNNNFVSCIGGVIILHISSSFVHDISIFSSPIYLAVFSLFLLLSSALLYTSIIRWTNT